MKTIKVIPLQEVNGVTFGMKRSDVRNIFGEATEFKKSKFSQTSADDFGFCHVYYNAENKCEAIELFDNVDVIVNGQLIPRCDIDSVKCMFPDAEEDDFGVICKSLSIGVYAPNNKIESILFGCKDYFE